MNQLVGTYTNLLLGGNNNIEELDYRCGSSSVPVAKTDRCEVYEDDEDCEDQEGDEDGDDESDGDGDVQADGYVSSFLTLHKLMENEQGIYVYVDMADCDPDLEDLEESSHVKYYLAPSPQFENVQKFGNDVSSDWTPWVNYNTRNSSGEFVIDHIFTS